MEHYKSHLQRQHMDSIDLACKMYPVLDKESLKKHEEELYNESYLPRYLLKELNIPQYYEDAINELKEWCMEHKEYRGLLKE